MPMYDRRCETCDTVREDILEPVGKFGPVPCECGGSLVRTIATGKFHRSTGVTPDGIVGGVVIRHGICNPDGSPRTYHSRSEMRRVARDFGMQSMVRHAPIPGTDKSPHTTRWVSAPVITEEERKRIWWETELADFGPPKPPERGTGVGLIVDPDHHISEIIRESFQKAESSGFNERDYVSPPPPRKRSV